FDSFFRFLAPLLDAEELLSEADFWKTVVQRLLDYRGQHPQFAERFDQLGLFAQSFPLSCLNRLQLRNNQQMLDLADQSGGLLYAGDLENPLATALIPAG
ncbi:MAG: IucA/IucC family C-terminal-domain containing protein, partial [Glutamicibacter sp.]